MVEIALNGLLLDSPFSGTATYTRGLVPALARVAPDLAFRLFVHTGGIDGVTTRSSRIPYLLNRLPLGAVGARADKLIWETVSWPVAAASRRDALMHSLYFAAPIVKPVLTVVTVHDVIPLVWPGYHRSRSSLLYARLMARNVATCRAVITVSEHARQDIVRTLGIEAERVFVTPEAVDSRFEPTPVPGERDRIRLTYGLPTRYVLYLGGAERRKNLDVLIRAWARVVDAMRACGLKLAIVATFPPPDALYPDTPALVREMGLSDDVTIIPSVSESDKPAIYRSALAFCFPSLYEGFGLPPLEAMACGTPVISSSATSLPEVVGDAGVMVPPDDVPAWSDALRVVVGSAPERARLSEAGVQRARLFSWDRTARQTVDVYRWVLR